MTDAITKPDGKKDWVQRFIGLAKGEVDKAPAAATPASTYLREAGSTAGTYGLAGILGGLLGATHAKWGLDSKAGPIDGWISGFGVLGSLWAAGRWPEAAAYARQAGAFAFNTLTFRKSFEAVKGTPLVGGTTGAVQRIVVPAGKGPGVAGEDPIERTAKSLDGAL
jgi:hypothetical protein